jgi:DNA-3-methyladenine glycosylase
MSEDSVIGDAAGEEPYLRSTIEGSGVQRMHSGAPRFRDLDFSQDSPQVARRLIGMRLLIDGVGGIIVETEAYDREDPASHSFSGPTPRNAVMFGPPGRAYVYLSYGIHWCLNFVCREAGHGAGVLIRALEPTAGIAVMMDRRRQHSLRLLCAGPGRLGEALGVTRGLNGKRVDEPPFSLTPALGAAQVVCGPRIGISKAVEQPWRFGLAGSRYVSRPFRRE